MQPRWYTVEYDENSIAWLIADEKDYVCLVHGMQVEVSKLAFKRMPRAKSAKPGTVATKKKPTRRA